MKCKCGKPISQHMKGKCLSCRYKEAQGFKRCVECETWFVPAERHYKQAKYCSAECKTKSQRRRERELWHRKQKFCRRCGKPISGTRNIYCSVECHYPQKQKKPKIRKPTEPIKRFLKPGIIPATEGWGDGEIIPVHPETSGKARIKERKLPVPPRAATKESRVYPPPMPSAYQRVIGNQFPPGPWERIH